MSRSATAAGWPVLAGLGALVLGLLMLGGTAILYRQAHQLIESMPQVAPTASDPVATNASSPVAAFMSQMPPVSTHLDDVGFLFKLAKERSVSIGPISYRTQAGSPLPVVMRMLDLRVEEEYPKLKAFVAELLRQMPHLYLEEIRVEQGSAATSKAQFTLKLSFVYQSSPAPAVVPAASGPAKAL